MTGPPADGGPDPAAGSDPGRAAVPGLNADPAVELPHRADLSPDTLETIAGEVGTPAYVYDARALDEGVERWTRVAPPDRVWYAVKANGNLTVLRRLAGHGLGFEAATAGELARVRAAGVETARAMLGGVPKRPAEVAEAVRAGLDLVVLQAAEEVEAATGSADPARPAPVGVRIRPGIRAGAHPALETGVPEAKFGLDPERALEVWRRLSGTAGLEPRTLSVHLGSGVDSPEPYGRALDLLLDLAAEAGRAGVPVREVDLGGGLAVDYRGSADPDPAALVEAVTARLRSFEQSAAIPVPAVRWEPGRSIVARMGLLLTRVLYRRRRNGRLAVVCDAAFTDFARPVLYGASHRVEPVEPPAGGSRGPPTSELLGATCESGDVLGRDLRLEGVAPGDLLVVRDAGAYGFAMASSYNGRPRPPEVLVEGDSRRVIRRRERIEDLWRGEEAWSLSE